MPREFLERLRQGIETAGFVAQMESSNRFGCALHCYKVEDEGNHRPAFRLLDGDGVRYALSYGYMVWAIPPDVDALAFAIAWLNIEGAWVIPPEELRERFRLQDVDFQGFLRVYGGEMKVPIPPSRRDREAN